MVNCDIMGIDNNVVFDFQPRVMWLLPSMTKSLVLSTELTKGPALILFTPVKPLGDVQHYYHMVRTAHQCTFNM